jgi:hypothetical protein
MVKDMALDKVLRVWIHDDSPRTWQERWLPWKRRRSVDLPAGDSQDGMTVTWDELGLARFEPPDPPS